MKQVNIEGDVPEDVIKQIELSNHSICHLEFRRDHLNHLMSQVEMIISGKKNRVATFSLKSSKEFILSADRVVELMTGSFVTLDIHNETNKDNVKIKLKIKKGMCKMTVKVHPNIKIKHVFPADDDISWGNTSLSLKDWNEIVAEVNTM